MTDEDVSTVPFFDGERTPAGLIRLACNVWRLVDLLVKLALDGEYTSYSPRVDANQFLTVAKNCYGLDPPD